MSEELGECPNNTENTVCLSPSCPYKHDRIWLDPEEIKSGMVQWEGTFIERKSGSAFLEPYVVTTLKHPSKCPCGCGGIFDLPKKKETNDAQGNYDE